MRKRVNADVAETTPNLIPELPPPSRPYLGAIIVNALYLKVGWQAIVLPVRSGMETLVLLPDTSLEQPLDPSVFEVRGTAAVALSLPKVDVRAKFALRETLGRLGAAEMFEPGAGFTGLSPDRPFLLALRHARSKAIYFLAQVARP